MVFCFVQVGVTYTRSLNGINATRDISLGCLLSIIIHHPIPLSRQDLRPGRLWTLLESGLLCHQIPIDEVPPPLGERQLAGDTVVGQVHMLPRVDAQQRGQFDSSRGKLVALVGRVPAGSSVCCVLEVFARRLHTLLGRADSGVQVDVLAAPVRTGVGRPSQVSGENLVGRETALLLVLHEPDKAGAKHGCGRVDHLLAQRLDRTERSFEVVLQRTGDLDGTLRQVLEEEMVVVRHAGVVEDGCRLGIASCSEESGLEVLAFPLVLLSRLS